MARHMTWRGLELELEMEVAYVRVPVFLGVLSTLINRAGWRETQKRIGSLSIFPIDKIGSAQIVQISTAQYNNSVSLLQSDETIIRGFFPDGTGRSSGIRIAIHRTVVRRARAAAHRL